MSRDQGSGPDRPEPAVTAIGFISPAYESSAGTPALCQMTISRGALNRSLWRGLAPAMA